MHLQALTKEALDSATKRRRELIPKAAVADAEVARLTPLLGDLQRTAEVGGHWGTWMVRGWLGGEERGGGRGA